MGILYAKVGGTWEPILGGSDGGMPPNWPDGYPTYDPRYINVDGDTMTGPLVLPAGTPTGDQAVSRVNGDALYVNDTGDTMTGALRIEMASSVASTIHTYAGNNMFLVRGHTAPLVEIGSDALPVGGHLLKVIGTSGAGAYMTFYEGTGLRGRVGRNPNMSVSAVSGWLELGTETSQPTLFNYANAEVARMISGGSFCIGRTSADMTVEGAHYGPNGIGATSSLAAGLVVLNRLSATNGQPFVKFQKTTNLTEVGSIAFASGSTNSIVYNTTSDYRLKNDLGPINDAVARVRRLRPIRVTWKNDEDGGEQDALFAHEVDEVVPEAVTGTKDAVDAEGNITPQQIDHSKLVPLLVAAVQELSAKVEDLQAELAILKGAA